MNIVSMAMQYLTPMLVDRIASSLGVSSPLVRTAIAAILPSILAGIAGVAAKPDGGRRISDVLAKQDTGVLGDLGSIFGGDRQAQVAKSGTDVLGGLLGGSAISGLSGAVSKFSNLGDAPTQSLIGMLGPVALGTLAQQQKASGLDAAGLTNFMMGQKDNIRAALPQGFDKLLAGTGLLDGIATPMPAAAASQPAQSRPAVEPRPAVANVTQAPAKAPANSNLWPMLAAAAALALGGWYFFGQSSPKLAVPAAPKITLGNQDVGAQLGSLAEGLRGTLLTLKDKQSAEAALPRLQEMQRQLTGINETAGKLPPEARKGLANYAAQLLPLLRPLIEKALSAAGVGPVAKPVLDQILSRLEGLAKA